MMLPQASSLWSQSTAAVAAAAGLAAGTPPADGVPVVDPSTPLIARDDLVAELERVLFDAGVLGALCRPIWAGFLSSY